MAKGPLQGVRIIDLTHVWAGPLATRILADLGADVVKVEASWARGPQGFARTTPLGGWLQGDAGSDPWNRNAVFNKLMRNKRSVCLDLKSEEGRASMLELVAVADVVIDNFSASTLADLGLGYEAQQRANPKIIYVSITGFGASGPYAKRVAFGTTVEPMSGLGQVLGYGPDEPRNTAMALPDPIAAVNASAAILTALDRRDRTGSGCDIEMSLHESAVGSCGPFLLEQQLNGNVACIGNGHPSMCPHGVYRAQGDDDWLAIACRDDEDWRQLCQVLGPPLGPELSFAERRAQSSSIDAAIEAWASQRSKFVATQELQAVGVPAGPVQSTPEMAADPQVIDRGFFVPLDEGTPMPGNPIHMAELSSADWTPCPKLGADNREVFRDWLDYDDDRIDVLEAAGTLASEPPA
jgi:crotonobetainyl-CoA:carnitine CoA-transferase CaiB-like acyl-CoA transferase